MSSAISDSSECVSGWMTVEQIAQLNGITDANPRFLQLSSALVCGLPARAHEKPAMAALGEKQYFYEHVGLSKVTQENKREIGISQSSAMNLSAFEECKATVGKLVSHSAPDPKPKRISQRDTKKEPLKAGSDKASATQVSQAAETKRLISSSSKMLSSARSYSVALQEKSDIGGKAYSSQLSANMKTFETNFNEFLEKSNKALVGGEVQNDDHQVNFRKHHAAFATFLSQVKTFLA